MKYAEEEKTMVGKVIFRQGFQTLEASLDEEAHWHCGDVNWERFLNRFCRLAVSCGDDEGLGWQILCQAAGVLNGQAVYC
jgi:hypothetical protein